MILLLMLLPAIGPPQEDAAGWVRKLGDDAIEVRVEAERKLLVIGEPARAALLKLGETGDAELNARIQRILRTLDIQKELRAWFAPPTRITLSGETTLEKAVREIERQSGQKVKCNAWPEGSFKIDLKDVPYWEALEKICEASGARSLLVSPDGPVLSGTKYVGIPSSSHGSFNIRFDTLVEFRRFPFASKTENRSLSMIMNLGWERSIAPTQVYLSLMEVRDSAGKDYLVAFREYEARSHPGGSWYVKEPAPTFMWPLHAGAFAALPEKADTLTARGSVHLWIRAAPTELELRLPAGADATEAKIEILDSNLKEAEPAGLRVFEFSRQGATATFRVAVSNLNLGMLRQTYSLWHLKDKAGKNYVVNVRQIQREGDRSCKYTLTATALPADSELESFVVRIPTRVLELEIPFELKNIPLK